MWLKTKHFHPSEQKRSVVSSIATTRRDQDHTARTVSDHQKKTKPILKVMMEKVVKYSKIKNKTKIH